MNRRALHILGGVAVLAAAIAAGWIATSMLQKTVNIRSDLSGCWRLEGTVAQTDCVSDQFLDGAAAAADGRTGTGRDAELVSYVAEQERAAAADSRLGRICHPAMHALGRREGSFAADQGRVPEFPAGSSQLCTAGYVHGLAEGYLTGTPDADVARVFPELCHDPAAREGCAHGVGHALLRAHASEAVATASRAAVDRCRDLPGDFPVNCLNGVYMELAMRTTPAPVSPSQYVRTCDHATDVDQALACWSYLGLDLGTNDIGLRDVPAWCARADRPGQLACIEDHGRDLGIDRVGMCADAGGDVNVSKRCIEGAVALQVGSGHVTAGHARSKCTQLHENDLERHCRDAVTRYARGRDQVVAPAAP